MDHIRKAVAVVDGQEVTLVSGTCNTGSPKYYEYVPGYLTTSGRGEVNSRFTTTGFFRNADGETVRIRMSLWGKAADEAQEHLMKAGRVATIRVKGARLVPYTDRNGVDRISISINNRSEYDVLKVSEPLSESGFAAAAARAERERSAQVESQAAYANPYSYSDAPF